MKSGPLCMQEAAIRPPDRFLEDSIKLYPLTKLAIGDGHRTSVNTTSTELHMPHTKLIEMKGKLNRSQEQWWIRQTLEIIVYVR